jgi:hypothetical protein
MPTGTNPASRWAALCALSEQGNFQIDAYVDHTVDWAKAPNGHTYSNKAPGPVLIGYPVFKVLDAWQTRGIASREARDEVRLHHRSANMRLLSVLFQLLPYLVLVFAWLREAQKAKLSEAAQEVLLVGLLFGTSTVCFLNSYFGHAIAATFILATALALYRGAIFWTGTFFGFAVLSEYSAALLALPLGVIAVSELRKTPRPREWLAMAGLSALVPGSLWAFYHWQAFGSVLSIANQYQNPLFQDTLHEPYSLWGILTLPSLGLVKELLFGSTRGLLFTQPWVLGLLCMVPFMKRDPSLAAQKARFFALVSFLLFILLNASFGGWHGGHSPGPRYLAPVLPLLGIVLAFSWDAWKVSFRIVLGTLLILSCLMQLVFLSFYGFAPPEVPLWAFYLSVAQGDHANTFFFRVMVGSSVFLCLACVRYRSLFQKKA